eukprot:g5992.t1
MSRATDIILTGGSSGGLAVYLNCDRVGEMIAAAAAAAATTTTTTTTTTATAPRYACLADAGFFLDHNNTAGGPTTSPQFRESFYAWNSTAAINQDCIKHYTALGEPWRCVFAQNVLPFIKSRLFMMQNLFDSWQMANILGIRCTTYNKDLSACGASDMAAIESYGQTMRGLLAAAPAGYGIFAPSCIAHCQSLDGSHLGPVAPEADVEARTASTQALYEEAGLIDLMTAPEPFGAFTFHLTFRVCGGSTVVGPRGSQSEEEGVTRRDETEFLFELARLHPSDDVLDYGCGVGA